MACALTARPEILFLDEPTTGLDPQSRRQLWDHIQAFRERGGTVLLTTHYMEEAERLCDRVAIMDHGRLIAAGTLRELIDHTVGNHRDVVLAIEQPVTAPPDGFEIGTDARRLVCRVADVGAELPALITRARSAGCAIEDVEVLRQGLHEVFLHLTGRELRE